MAPLWNPEMWGIDNTTTPILLSFTPPTPSFWSRGQWVWGGQSLRTWSHGAWSPRVGHPMTTAYRSIRTHGNTPSQHSQSLIHPSQLNTHHPVEILVGNEKNGQSDHYAVRVWVCFFPSSFLARMELILILFKNWSNVFGIFFIIDQNTAKMSLNRPPVGPILYWFI